MSHPLLPFSRLIWISATSFHLPCTFLSALDVWAVCCKHFDQCIQSKRHLISTIRGSIKINYLRLQSQRISDSTAEKCCDQCAKEQCVSSSSCSVLQIGPSSRQHDMISQCSLSAYTQLVVHAQLWCQSLCGKSWCMEWGACLGSMGLLLSWQSSSWSVLCKKKKKVNWCTWGCSFALLHQSLVSFALHGRAVVTVGLNCCDHQKDVVISKVFFHQSGHSPKIIRAGLERTDSQTVGEFPSRRRKGRYTTLNCCASEYFSFCDLFTLYFILILCML